MSSEKIIALYERLSREDENLVESYSIQNQKKLLEDFCREKGWTRFRHFTDVYNQRLIPFDTKMAVQTPKITAFEGKNACRKPLFLFLGFMLFDCRVHQCTQQTRGGCKCTQAN